MNVNKVFRKLPLFENGCLDVVLVEGKYPVLFTFKNGKDIYLSACNMVSGDAAKWIVSKVSYKILIQLLKNEITIRDAFLTNVDKNLVIEYNGNCVSYTPFGSRHVDLLPTEGEYMEVEDGEYEEEIRMFESKS